MSDDPTTNPGGDVAPTPTAATPAVAVPTPATQPTAAPPSAVATEVWAPPPAGLHIAGLTVRLRERVILDAVSLSAGVGAVTALIGPNGAGKSTLIAAALGLVTSERGHVHLAGQDLLRMERRARARLVGYVPQRSLLTAPLLVQEVVAQGLYAHGGGLSGLFGASRHLVERALTAVGAVALSRRRFNELSAGEAQRVLVARALVGGAQTLLLDEPTAALDIGHALGLLELLRRLAAEGCTILVALHHLDEVRRVADQAVLLHHGRVWSAGPPQQVLASGELTSAFGVETDPAGALAFRLASNSGRDRP